MAIKEIYENVKKTMVKAARVDDWQNAITGLGTSRDKRSYSEFGASNRISQNHTALDEMYHGNGMVRRICDIYADEQTKKWFTLQVQDSDMDEKVAAAVTQELQSLKARERVSDAIVWARLFGGSVILIGVDDGHEQSEPLSMDAIKSVDWLRVCDRFEAIPFAWYTSTDEDAPEEKIGDVKQYLISRGSTGEQTIVHESRTIRFDGVRTSKRKQCENNGWNDSAIESIYETLRDFDSSFRSMSNLLQDFSQGIYKMKGLANMLAGDGEGVIMKRLLQLDLGRSIARAIPMDVDEDFQRHGAQVNGLAELLEKSMLRLSADTGIPITRLFGQSAKGLSATGEGDENDFINAVQSMQETKLRPRLEYLIELIMLSSDGPTGGNIPEGWAIKFNPLKQKSGKEDAEERKIVAETDKIYIESGVVSQNEVRVSRYAGAEYSAETSLDDDAYEEPAEDKPEEDSKEDSLSLVVFKKSAKLRGRNA